MSEQEDIKQSMQPLVDAIATKWPDRVAMWIKDHKPGKPLPVHIHPITGELVWMNRKQRRS